MQSIGNLHRVGGEGLTHPWDANAYVLKGGQEASVLIDCGSKLGYPELQKNLGALGVDASSIEVVLATHCHWDHVSGMDGFPNAQLFIHDEDLPTVQAGDGNRMACFLYGQEGEPIEGSTGIEDGFTVDVDDATVRAIHTPGHTPGSVSYDISLPEGRILILGDTLYGGFHPDTGSDIVKWKQSLQKLRAIPDVFDFLTFGHAVGRLLPDVDTRLEEADRQLGTYFNPWFKPFDGEFWY